MPLLKLLLKPDEISYSIREPASVTRVELPGGPSRYRADALNVDSMIDCQFTLTPEKFQYLRAFYNYTDQGASDFLMDLIVDSHTLREYQVRFRPGSWKLSNVEGLRFRVKVSLDVVSNTDGLDFADIVDVFVGDVADPGYTTGIKHFKLLPDQTNFSLEDPDGQVVTALKAPSEGARANHANTEMKATVQFSLSGEEYDYARAFYQTHAGGSVAFISTLLGEDRELRSYVSRLIPGTWRLNRVAQNMFSVKWDLHILPYDVYTDHVELFTTYAPTGYITPVYPTDFGGEEFL